MRSSVAWLFEPLDGSRGSLSAIGWWERRRIPFNLIVGTYGVVCLVIFAVAISVSGELKPGEDAVEPLMLMAAPFGINILYTLGWLVEAPIRLFYPALTPRFGPTLLKLGLGLGLFLITVPAAYWTGYAILRKAGVA